MDELVSFLKTHYEKDIDETFSVAKEALNQRFLFNQRWDMERTYVPEVFEGEINFLHQPGDDPEWIYAFNRLKHFISLGQAFAISGDEKYAECFASQAELWIDKVKCDEPKCAKAWRTIEVGIRLDSFVKAYLLMKDSDAFKKIEKKFLSSVNEHAAFILKNSWDSYHLMSNWGVLSNHGLYTAACVFGCEEWRAEALRRLSLELENEIYDDGSQWEQSPMYHNEVLRDYLDVILFSKLYGHELEAWFVEKVHKMALVNLKWMKPDGHEPMMGDSDDIDMRDLLTYSAYVFKDSNLKAVGYPSLDYETSFLVGMLGVNEYDELECEFPQTLDYFQSDSGNGFARSGWGREDSYLRFHAGTLGAGHGHADQTHISFTDKGKDFLVDAGRFTYVFGESRKAFKDNRAHNLVIVDGRECYPEKDSWECYELDRAVNVRASFKGNAVAFEGGHLAYMDKGVFANRKVVWLKDQELLFVIDEFFASGKHRYEQIFHFSEELEPVITEGGVKVGDCLVTCLSVGPLEQKITDSEISRHYNQRESNKALVTVLEAEGEASIITVFDFSESKGKCALVEVESTFKGIIFPSKTIEAVEVSSKDRDIVLVCAHKEYASPTDTYLAAGCVGFGTLTVFDKKRGICKIGNRLFT